MTSHLEWERGDRCRDCGIRPDEALGLAFCQCPDKQPLDELADRAVAEGRRLERAAVVAWLHASADFANRSGKYADESAANRIALALERGEHEKGEDK